MIKKLFIITAVIFLISSCDILMSFWISPVFNIPVSRSGWTVDAARIIGDSEYYGDQEWPLNWVTGTNTLLFSDYHDDNINVSTLGFPLEMSKYERVNSPLFYFYLLFRHDFGGSVGIDLDQAVIQNVPLENIYMGRDGNNEVNVDYTMDVNTSGGMIPFYSLPEPAYLGIDGNDSTTELAGSLYTVDFDIYADHDFVGGHATCVFSDANPAGLLYMVYYHDGGLVSLIYAKDVATTVVGNLFPDGHYEYIWSVFRND